MEAFKFNIDGVTEEQAAQVYSLSLQYFDAQEIARLASVPVEIVTSVLKRADRCIAKIHKNNPMKRSGDPVSWQKNLDELTFIRSEAWRLFTSLDMKDKIKILDQLRRVNRDIAELQGLLAPVKVESQTTLTIADESRKALKDMFGGK